MSDAAPTAIVEKIFIAPAGGVGMQSVDRAEAVADAGLLGDRYLKRSGYWTNVDECQVTFIEAEALELIQEQTTVSITKGEHRRNIVTRGVSLYELAGKRWRAGGAVFEFDRPRPPCRYIQSVSEKGMTKALGGNRGGICARVVESGPVRPGDAIEVIGDSETAGRPARPMRRLLGF